MALQREQTRQRQFGAAPVLLAAGLCALTVGWVVPLASPLLVALLLGGVAANTRWRASSLMADHGAATKLLLRVGVVLVGLRLPLQDLAEVGVRGVVVILLAVGVTFTVTCLVGDRLRLDRGLVTLIAAGFSICGAAAIAAVSGGIRRREEDVALAIALVTIFGSIMIGVVPVVSGLMGLTQLQQGVWAGASIHEVAQVVAAATVAGPVAVAVAMTVKLGRVALLAPVYVLARRRDGLGAGDGGAPVLPWFVIGFLLAAALRTTGLLPEPVLDVTNEVTTLLLAAAMFGLGLGLVVRELFPIPLRAVALATISTVVAAGVSLAATLLLF